MKKLLFSFLVLSLIYSECMSANGVKIGELYYLLDYDAMTAKVTYELYPDIHNYAELSAVKVPEKVTYEGKSFAVNTIGANAFAWSPIRKIILPDGVAAIEEQAFEGCTGLESVRLPKDLNAIGENAFLHCVNLASVKTPAHLKISRISKQSLSTSHPTLNMADYQYIAEKERNKLNTEIFSNKKVMTEWSGNQSFALPPSSIIDYSDGILINLLRSCLWEYHYKDQLMNMQQNNH